MAELVFVGVWMEHTAFIVGSSGTGTVTLRVTLCRIPKDMNPQKKKMAVETSNLAHSNCQSAVSGNDY